MKLIQIIEKYICEQRGLNPDDLHKRDRHKEVKETRQIIMYFAMTNGITERNASLYFGLNHATANHTKKTIKGWAETDRKFREEMSRYQFEIMALITPKRLLVCEIQDEIENLTQRLHQLKSIAV